MADNTIKREELEKLIKEVVEKNKSYSRDQVEFTPYCKRKMTDRGIKEGLVLDILHGSKVPYFVEIQRVPHKKEIETRHKLIYKISNKYSLIVVIIYYESILNVINVIRTSKSAEKLWRKKILE